MPGSTREKIRRIVNMADFIEGKRPVIEALRTGVPIKSILMADNVQRDGLIEDILRKAKRAGATVEMVPRKVLDGKSDRGSHQGVMAKAASFPYVGIGDVIDAAGKSAEQHDGRALVMGNEQEGISRLVMEHCDFLVKLPIEGEVASLNVAQAATACMYEWLRQNQ